MTASGAMRGPVAEAAFVLGLLCYAAGGSAVSRADTSVPTAPAKPNVLLMLCDGATKLPGSSLSIWGRGRSSLLER
jgi:hypothetical protein